MPFAGGDGSQSNPYQIETWEHLDSVRNNLSSHFVLNNDLDNSTTGYTGIGDDFEPIGFISGTQFSSEFSGTFDGKGYAIQDLVINKNDLGDVALFASTDTGSLIENVFVSGEVTNLSTDAGTVAGLVGIQKGGSIKNCGVKVTVDSPDCVRAGCLTGVTQNSSVNDCYALGSVTANDRVGGLCGEVNSATVENCYSTASVTGNTDVGGLIGANFGTITDCYWDTESSGQSSSAAGTGLTTSEMQGQEASTNMSGFDFTNNWDTVTSEQNSATADGYPILIALDETNQLKAQGIKFVFPQGLFVWTGSTWKKVAGV